MAEPAAREVILRRLRDMRRADQIRYTEGYYPAEYRQRAQEDADLLTLLLAEAPARPTAEQIALVELVRNRLLREAEVFAGGDSMDRKIQAEYIAEADALRALLTAVTGKDTP